MQLDSQQCLFMTTDNKISIKFFLKKKNHFISSVLSRIADWGYLGFSINFCFTNYMVCNMMLWYMYTMQNYIKSNSLMYPSSCLFVIIYNDINTPYPSETLHPLVDSWKFNNWSCERIQPTPVHHCKTSYLKLIPLHSLEVPSFLPQFRLTENIFYWLLSSFLATEIMSSWPIYWPICLWLARGGWDQMIKTMNGSATDMVVMTDIS